MPLPITDDELQAALMFHSTLFTNLWNSGAGLQDDTSRPYALLGDAAVGVLKCCMVAEAERRFGMFARQGFKRIRKRVEESLVQLGVYREAVREASESLQTDPEGSVRVLAARGRSVLREVPTLTPRGVERYTVFMIAQEIGG